MLGAGFVKSTVSTAKGSSLPLTVGSTVKVTGSHACFCVLQIVCTKPAGEPPCIGCDSTKTCDGFLKLIVAVSGFEPDAGTVTRTAIAITATPPNAANKRFIVVPP